jgi:protein-S-isoprenylcysteine O-methyltransferase Ste14
MSRRSDRWMTPGVAAVLVLCGTVVVLAVLAAVTYLTARGFDPQPVVQLAGTLVAAVASLGTFLAQLVNRRTTAKVERNTGLLASGVADTLDELDRRVGRHSWSET